MPLYLVRWANLDLALVHAQDEDELTDMLDEVDDPASATWQVYRGPLYLGFKSRIDLGIAEGERDQPLAPEDIHLSGIQEAFESGCLHAPEPLEELYTEAASQMYERLLKKAFPRLHRQWMKEDHSGETINRAAWEKAVMAELEPLFEYSRRAHEVSLSPDPESQLLASMGLVELTPRMAHTFEQLDAEAAARAKVKEVRELPDEFASEPRDGQRATLPGRRRR